MCEENSYILVDGFLVFSLGDYTVCWSGAVLVLEILVLLFLNGRSTRSEQLVSSGFD